MWYNYTATVDKADKEGVKPKEEHKDKHESLVFPSHTVVHPGAVLIKSVHALVADMAMLGS